MNFHFYGAHFKIGFHVPFLQRNAEKKKKKGLYISEDRSRSLRLMCLLGLFPASLQPVRPEHILWHANDMERARICKKKKLYRGTSKIYIYRTVSRYNRCKVETAVKWRNESSLRFLLKCYQLPRGNRNEEERHIDTDLTPDSLIDRKKFFRVP